MDARLNGNVRALVKCKPATSFFPKTGAATVLVSRHCDAPVRIPKAGDDDNDDDQRIGASTL